MPGFGFGFSGSSLASSGLRVRCGGQGSGSAPRANADRWGIFGVQIVAPRSCTLGRNSSGADGLGLQHLCTCH